MAGVVVEVEPERCLRLVHRDLDGVHALFNYFKWHNWKRIAIMSTTDASGQEGDIVMQQLLAMSDFRGYQVTDWEHFAPADLSVAAQMIAQSIP